MRRVPFVAILTGAVALAACESRRTAEVASAELLGLEADQVMVGVEHYMTREGVRRALLLADTAFTYQDEERLRLRNLKITFFGELGEESAVLTAGTGVYEMESGDLEVEGEVEVVDGSTGERLVTERLRYVAEPDSLYGDTAFVLYRGDVEMRGARFVTDPELRNFRAESPSFVSRGSEIEEVQPVPPKVLPLRELRSKQRDGPDTGTRVDAEAAPGTEAQPPAPEPR
jgi:LPS export ABC transporter protein LptC